MGVKNLWKLMGPAGRRIAIETLRGKALAVDASIWITQFIKAMRDSDGNIIQNAHVLGTLRRICRLLFHRIRPVFVFDGGTPVLKRRTVLKRTMARQSQSAQLQRAAQKLVLNMVRQQQIHKRQGHSRKGKRGPAAANRTPASAAVASMSTASRAKVPDGSSSESGSDIEMTAGALSGRGTGNRYWRVPKSEIEARQETVRQRARRAASASKSSKAGPGRLRKRGRKSQKLASSGSNSSGKSSSVANGGHSMPHSMSATEGADQRLARKQSGGAAADDVLESESEDEGGYEDFDVGTGGEFPPSVPVVSNADDVDFSVLKSLPPSMQQEYVDEVKRVRRQASRSRMLPVAADPQGFSQLSLGSFLKDASLSIAVDKMNRQQAKEAMQGNVIVSEANRQFLLVKDGEADAAIQEAMQAGEISGRNLIEDAGASRGVVSGDDQSGHAAASMTLDLNESDLGSAAECGQPKLKQTGDSPSLLSAAGSKRGIVEVDSGGLIRAANRYPSMSLSIDATEGDFEDASEEEEVESTQTKSSLPQHGTESHRGPRSTTAEDGSLSHNKKPSLEHETETARLAAVAEALGLSVAEAAKLVQTGTQSGQTEACDEQHSTASESGSDGWEDAEEAASDQDSADAHTSSGVEAEVPSANCAVLDSSKEYCDGKRGETKPVDSDGEEYVLEGGGGFFMEPDAGTVHDDESRPVPGFDGKVADSNAGVCAEATKVSIVPLESSDASEPHGVVAGDSDDQLAVSQLDVSEGADGGAGGFIPETRQQQSAGRASSSIDSDEANNEASAASGSTQGAAPPHQLYGAAQTAAASTIPIIGQDESGLSSQKGSAVKGEHSARLSHGAGSSSSAEQAALDEALKMAGSMAGWAGAAMRRAVQATTGKAVQPVLPTGQPSSSTPSKVRAGASSAASSRDEQAASDPHAVQQYSNLEAGNSTVQPTDCAIDRGSTGVSQVASEDFPDSGFHTEGFSSSSRTLADSGSSSQQQLDGDETGPTANADLEELEELEKQEKELRKTRRSAGKAAESMQDGMLEDIVELLNVFGIPYLRAPMEAEAQCAELERLGLVEGVITDDSDAFLFGARHVYRNIFDQGKYVEEYRMPDIEADLGLSRESLQRLALFLGSDYTDGLKGIGIVTASEIMHAFPGDEGLKEFADWVKSVSPDELKGKKKPSKAELESSDPKTRFKLVHQSMKRSLILPDSFPSARVLEAYRKPRVNSSEQKFTWQTPNPKHVVPLLQRKIGWEERRTAELLDPVVKALKERRVQRSIEGYAVLQYDASQRASKVVSRRMRAALGGLRRKERVGSAKGRASRGAASSGDDSEELEDIALPDREVAALAKARRQQRQRELKALVDLAEEAEGTGCGSEDQLPVGAKRRRDQLQSRRSPGAPTGLSVESEGSDEDTESSSDDGETVEDLVLRMQLTRQRRKARPQRKKRRWS